MSTSSPQTRQKTNRSGALGQIMFCEGCCCGRVDRGKPEFPKDRVKAEWKSKKLNKAIQLTISGCLGPCDLVNVACILGSDGQMIWLGGLCEPEHYDWLIEWATACQTESRFLDLPAALKPFRFERFVQLPAAVESANASMSPTSVD